MQIKTCCEPGEAKQVQSISEAQTKRPYRQNFRWLRLVRMRNTHQKHLKESLINFFKLKKNAFTLPSSGLENDCL